MTHEIPTISPLTKALQDFCDAAASKIADEIGAPETLLFIAWIRSGGFPRITSAEVPPATTEDQ